MIGLKRKQEEGQKFGQKLDCEQPSIAYIWEDKAETSVFDFKSLFVQNLSMQGDNCYRRCTWNQSDDSSPITNWTVFHPTAKTKYKTRLTVGQCSNVSFSNYF